MKHLHYQTDAEALAVVVDSDDSPVHLSTHDAAEITSCRFCQIRSAIARGKASLRAIPGRDVVKTAIGLAVPSIEAWYRCGVDSRVTEAAWIQKLQSGKCKYSRESLKRDVYGTDRPSIGMEITFAEKAASQLVNHLSILEEFFPNGFGPFAREVRSWSLK